MRISRNFALCFVCFVLGAGAALGYIYFSPDGAGYKLSALESKYTRDSAEFTKRLNDVAATARSAEAASAESSRLLAEYRLSVEKRERERQTTIDRIIGEAVQGGSGATEIANGLDGDIEIARRIENSLGRLVSGLRILQSGSYEGTTIP